MNKLSSILVVGVVSLFMSSCFLFRTHTDCPAYGSNVKEKTLQKDELTKKESLLILEENKI